MATIQLNMLHVVNWFIVIDYKKRFNLIESYAKPKVNEN